MALREKVLVIRGGPDVGKTTVLSSILKLLLARGREPLLCAPTDKAAKRMSQARDVSAKTNYRATLEYGLASKQFRRNRSTCSIITSWLWTRAP